MSKQSWRKRSMSATDIPGDLPINNPESAVARKESARSALARKMIHLIPVVVISCFFVLWCFSYPVVLETKDGVSRFVSIMKKTRPGGEENDLDVTVLALETPPADDFMTISDAPAIPPVAHHERPKVSLLEIHDDLNASLKHVTNESLVSHSRGHSEVLADSQESKVSLSVSYDVEVVFQDSTEPRISYPETILEVAPEPSGDS